ncbi:MAG: amidohydrolase/deacetylase family metallohydrolase [Xenococcaceae cyanobacterium MO_167.B27]|nr:amidohydrolase/deacetylase family metallohydrolase [Xenococcaceae cyanobacterium MO_167.B27]
MNNNSEQYDLVLKGGHVIDPASNLNGIYDVAIRDQKIAKIVAQLPSEQAKEIVSVEGKIVCPGLIDLHAHVYEWVVSDSLCADDVGINSGVTTVVDQGDCGSANFLGFKAYVVEKSVTDVRCFPCINILGTASPDSDKTALYGPDMVDIEALVSLAQENPQIIRGIKTHGESGLMSRWGTQVIQLARKATDLANLPLYLHTGVLFDIEESNRPQVDQVIDQVIPFLKPGDLLTHCYGMRPDGLLGKRLKISGSLKEAIQEGILLDLGHGVHFSFNVARRMIEQGFRPYTISSDVHGDFTIPHSDAFLKYSLCGIMSKFLALGFTLEEVIAGTTINPARVLRAEMEIGTLQTGSRADITVLDLVDGDFVFHDSINDRLVGNQQLVPTLVVRAGQVLHPHGRLLRDLQPI